MDIKFHAETLWIGYWSHAYCTFKKYTVYKYTVHHIYIFMFTKTKRTCFRWVELQAKSVNLVQIQSTFLQLLLICHINFLFELEPNWNKNYFIEPEPNLKKKINGIYIRSHQWFFFVGKRLYVCLLYASTYLWKRI